MSVARAILVSSLLFVPLSSSAPAEEGGTGTTVIDGMEIHQLERVLREGNEGHWVARLDKWPVKTGTEGYRPAGEEPTTWSPNVEFRWNFGDDSGWISTGERPSVAHRYEERGSYTLQVEAVSPADTVREQMIVEVGDRDLRARTIDAIELDAGRGTYELSADVYGDDDDDEMKITWKLDGEQIATGLWKDRWRIERVIERGTREVSALWLAEDGSTTEKTVEMSFLGPRDVDDAEPGEDRLETLDRQAQREGVRSYFDGEIQGFLSSKVHAEVRPFVGIFLGAPSSGPCRFQMTALDPEGLLAVELMANLPNLTEEGHRYRYNASIVKLATHPDAEAYLHHYRGSGFNEAVTRRLGGVDLRGFSEETINRRLRDKEAGFVQIGERERQYVMVEVNGEQTRKDIRAEAPAAQSPFPPPEFGQGGFGFQGVSGSVELLVVPESRVVAKLDMTLEGGTRFDRRACDQGRPWVDHPPRGRGEPAAPRQILGRCRTIDLEADLVLDLKQAPRDGLVTYAGCFDPPDFDIRGIYGPKDGERHVWERRPRISVSFTDDVDPATLNSSTFQLTYLDRTGRHQPVTTRLFRDPDGAFLKPVAPLWGGVNYTVRVKTGEDGVRSFEGGMLEAGEDDDEGWVTRDFWTRLDFVPDAASSENLSCHVYQNVRDAPLLVGRRAVALIHADWIDQRRVSRDGQTKQLPARVVLEKHTAAGWEELSRVAHTFQRPDLAPPPDAHLTNQAKLPFTPDRSTPATLRVTLELETREGWFPTHRALCSSPVWKHEPVMEIELVTVSGSAAVSEADLQGLKKKVGRRDFPLSGIDVRIGPALGPSEGRWEPREARRQRASNGGSDLLIVVDHSNPWFPYDAVAPPFMAYSQVPVRGTDAEAGRSLDFTETGGRIAHEIGHALGLPDLPWQGSHLSLWSRDSGTEWHDGIESAYFHSESGRWVFVSSRYGNWFDSVPLMYFRVSLMYQSWLLRHHYLQIQELIEDTGYLLP